jgi:hypothetical protein
LAALMPEEEFANIPPRPERQGKGKEGHDGPGPGWRDAQRVTYVWDLSQTTGQPLAVPAGLPPGQAPPGMLDALRWLARREGFAVEHEQGGPADGTIFWAARRIRLPRHRAPSGYRPARHEPGHTLTSATLAADTPPLPTPPFAVIPV